MTTRDPFAPERLAAALETARSSGRAAPAGSLPEPPDVDAAYRVQAARWTDRPVPGWKVALDAEGRSLFAPLDPVVRAGAGAWRPGLGLEVEIAYVLGADLPARPERPYARSEIEAAVASVHLGLELVMNRLVEGSGAPLPLFLADALGNAGYILGPALAADDPRHGMPLQVSLGERILFSGLARHAHADPLLPLMARANRPAPGWGDLMKGQVVTTGSLCGVLSIDAPGELTVTAGAARMTASLRAER